MELDNLSDKQLIVEYDKFLQNHKVEKGTLDWTHSAYGTPWGSYKIPDYKYDNFLNLYKRITSIHSELHIIERQKEVGPFLIDIDYRTNKSYKTRVYTKEHIKKVITIANKMIKKYINIQEKRIEAFVLEKDSPTEEIEKGTYKDGFHIIYSLPINIKMRKFLYHKIKIQAKKNKIFDDIDYLNKKGYDEIFDIAVVERNGWLLHNSWKHQSKKYFLTHIFDHKMVEKNLNIYDNNELIVLLSVRQFGEEDELLNKPRHDIDELSKDITKKKELKKDLEIQVDIEKKVNNLLMDKRDEKKIEIGDLSDAVKLVKLLKDDRAYDYTSWIYVGWTLFNISESLLNSFIEFSKKSKEKYKDGCCQEIWRKAKKGNMGLKTLHNWAKEDNSEEYFKFIRSKISPYITKAESGTHNDIAVVLYEMYKHTFVCTSITNNTWYEFQGHRWVKIDSGFTLANRITDELKKEFLYVSASYLEGCKDLDGNDRDDKINKTKKSIKVINQLGNETFIKSVISACSRRFYKTDFVDLLDENKDLLGFDNGVYDLKTLFFRAGLPDDYITLSCGYDYVEYEEKSEEILEVMDYLRKVQTEPDLLEYLGKYMASCLDGYSRNQKFVVWTGSGGNGKSTTTDLLQYALGKYCGFLSVSILTKKRGSSSAASPELANKKGVRAVFLQEPEHDEEIYVGQMKNFTGGDWVEVRDLYGKPFKYKPQFKLTLTCNKLPHIPANDDGTWRRIRVLPWESKFVDDPKNEKEFKKDLYLAEKLEKWKQAFMWILINTYYKDYIKTGLKEPKKVTEYTDKYKKTNDQILEFFSEEYEITKNNKNKIAMKEMYREFTLWCRDNNMFQPPSGKEFTSYFENINEVKIISGSMYGVKQKIKQEDQSIN
jgi:P4 family phage/plasmid primase-like protien